MSNKTRKVKLKISRHETWYPEIEVDDHLNDEEIVEMVESGEHEDCDRVYDEFKNRDTYHYDGYTETLKQSESKRQS